MLPAHNDPAFPSALKARREALNMSRSELARAAGIHPVMPRRYEDPECAEFSQPRLDTWRALNAALGFNTQENPMEKAQPDRAIGRAEKSSTTTSPLTIDEAKAGLASYFGVPPSNIEITIKY